MGLRLVFLGPPGVGKGTQAQALAAARAIPHISTGDILRAEVGAGSELGNQAQAFMNRGELVPDDLVVAMVARRLAQPDCADGWLLDGFPRTGAQAAALEKHLAQTGENVDRVLYFRAADEILIRRLSGRRACPECNANYHVEAMPPRTEGVCDQCGSALIQRPDDQEDTIRNRLDVYRAQTRELIDHYRAAGLLTEIDSEGTVDEVAAATAGSLEG